MTNAKNIRDFLLQRKSIVNEQSSAAEFEDRATQSPIIDVIYDDGVTDQAIPVPQNVRVAQATIVTQPDGTKKVQLVLLWDDVGQNFEYEVQVGLAQ